MPYSSCPVPTVVYVPWAHSYKSFWQRTTVSMGRQMQATRQMVPRYCRGVRARESHSSAHNRNNSAIDLQTLARARAFSPSAAGGAYTKRNTWQRSDSWVFSREEEENRRGGRMLAYAPYQRGLTGHLRAGNA